MKKQLLIVIFILVSFCTYGQVSSIVPNSASKGTTLRTVITMAQNVLLWSSPPMGATDVYLQQGSTIIYVDAFDPAVNIYPGWFQYSDSMYVDWTIPANIPSGSYDVHVLTYDGSFPPSYFDNILASGFLINGAAGTIEGDVFFDYNQNGLRDGNDYALRNQRVQLNPVNFTTYTNSSGHYSAYLDSGNYTASLILGSYTLTTANPSYNVTLPPSSTGNDFGVYNASVGLSQSFYAWHHPMRCNALGYTYIYQGNYSPIPVNGSITMIHSNNMPFNASIPPPDVISGDTLVWYYNNLLPGQALHIGNPYITFNNPPAGQTIWWAIYDSVFDNSNTLLGVLRDTFSFAVSCAVDPNDKLVSPQGATAQHYVPMNSPLTFTINFQNTGNDTAFNVVILDTLDFDLDLSTFEVLGSSDPVNIQMDANGAIQFRFDNILLPDSNIDEPGSHGMVIYKINPKAGLTDPTQITNTAHIVFDFNGAIVTNTSLTTLSNLQYPSASFNVADPTICQNSCIVFNDQSSSGTTYSWSFPGGNPASSSNANPGAVCYNTVGQFDVQLIVSNPLGSDTLTQIQYVNVSSSPAGLNVTQSGDTLWANAGYDSYQWFYENDSIQGATGQYYVAPISGDYGIVVANLNGCTSGVNIPNVISAISEMIDSKGILLYPNPTSGEFEISFSAFGKTNARIVVTNSTGQTVSDKSIVINSGINKIKFDESILTEGIYSVQIISTEQTITKQLLKTK